LPDTSTAMEEARWRTIQKDREGGETNALSCPG